MAYALPIELYEAIKKIVKDENLAREVAKTIEKSLEIVEDKAKEQKVVVKAELKDELKKELITKEEFFGEIKRLEVEIKRIEEKIDSVKQEMRLYFKLLFVLILLMAFFFNPKFYEALKQFIMLFK